MAPQPEDNKVPGVPFMKPPYEIKNIKSSKIPAQGEIDIIKASEIADLIRKHFKKAKAVCWLHYSLKFANVDEAGVLKMDSEDLKNFDKHLVRLRVFDQKGELHIWRSGNILKYRIRIDSEGAGTDYIDSNLILNGTKVEVTDEGIKITEERGIKMILPFFEQKQVLNTEKRLKLHTRNYIDYNDIGQAGYIDCRFMDITI